MFFVDLNDIFSCVDFDRVFGNLSGCREKTMRECNFCVLTNMLEV